MYIYKVYTHIYIYLGITRIYIYIYISVYNHDNKDNNDYNDNNDNNEKVAGAWLNYIYFGSCFNPGENDPTWSRLTKPWFYVCFIDF